MKAPGDSVKHKNGLEGVVLEVYTNAVLVRWNNGTIWTCWLEELE